MARKDGEVPATTTFEQTITPGPAARAGNDGSYHELRFADGEPHEVRGDLAARRGPIGTRSLLHLVHLTDLQLADVQSPGRLEFLHDHVGQPGFEELIPMFRPQELLGVHATEATVATINALGASPLTGAPLQLAITTGDNIDNAQLNELDLYLRALSGGPVDVRSGRGDADGPQDVGDRRFWSPDAARDDYQVRFGFPRAPGLLAAARRPFVAAGLAVPWLTAYGNHDGLFQGRAAFDPATTSVLLGGRKPTALPAGPVADIVTRAGELLTGPSRPVAPDPRRRPVTRREYVAAHFRDGGDPVGHGFTDDNRADGTAYYVRDLPDVRLITLDTTNPGGFQHGSIGARQIAWLERRLVEVHRTYLDTSGRTVGGGGDDRLVVLCSHHGADTLTNTVVRPGPGEEDPDLPRHLAPDLLALLHRFPNVVLWLSGHVHRHAVRAHPGPAGGLWEVTTAAVMEWPCQVRVLEVIDNADGTVSVVSTVLDHLAPLRASGLDRVLDLAAWHRELACNDPTSVAGRAAVGIRGDRNVELVVADPRRR